MKKLHLFFLIGLGACSGAIQKQTSVIPATANLSTPVKSADFDYMNLQVNPADDFYEFANGKWLQNNPVPETETRWGSFNEVQENNNKIISEILNEAQKNSSAAGTTAQLIGDFYFSILDSTARAKASFSPMVPILKQIDQINDPKSLAIALAELQLLGYHIFFDGGVEQDLRINTKNMLYIGQGGLGLPNRDYYTKEDEFYSNLRDQYLKHAESLLSAVKQSQSPRTAFMIEKKLAEASMDPVQLRDYEAQYNKIALNDLIKRYNNFSWDIYFNKLGLNDLDSVIVTQPDFLKAFNELCGNENMENLKAYMRWMVVNQSASLLSPELEKLAFDFYGKTIRGQKQMKPAQKRAIDIINNSALSEALGKAFVEKAFPEEAKAKVDKMVDDLIAAFEVRLKNLTWMSIATKKEALRKLSSFTRKLGYPDNWTDYSSLKITRSSYFDNALACRSFLIKKNLGDLKKPIDKAKWEMPPHIVNAYYNPLLNEIVFPAGILQPPFFDAKAEDAVNYARMGAVIGHELTHGFDDQGAQFTAEGVFKNWWSESDFVQFQMRTTKLVNQYNSFQPVPGVFVNGKLTLGENIADFGGLTIAYYAYLRTLKGKKKTKLEGFTPEQRFFIAFAQIWKTNITEKALRHQVDTDPHSPARYRVNGTLANMPEFFEAFKIAKGKPMRLEDADRAIIW
jgi:putative endopeptidase